MQEWLQQNSPVDGEDLERHDKWLCMMWPRLHLLRELLSDDGVIFISIDDNEQQHLRILLDEIFGSENFIALLPTILNLKGNNDRFGFSDTHEYVFCFAKIFENVIIKEFIIDDDDKLSEWSEDEFGYYKQSGPLKATGIDAPRENRPNLYYPIFVSKDGAIEVTEDDEKPSDDYEVLFPITDAIEMRWVWGKDKLRKNLHEIILKRTSKGISLYTKRRPKLGDLPTEKPKSFLYKPSYSSSGATAELKQIFGMKVFDYPKPHRLLKDLFHITTDENDIILDSFAGSGTTAHAVLALNKEDGGNRKFIMVECEDYADTITAERVRRVIKGVPEAKDPNLREGLGGSFTYCTLGDPIDIEEMLTGKSLPTYSELAAYLLHTASGISSGQQDLASQNEDGLFYSSDTTDYYLLYENSLDWLRSNDAIFKESHANRIFDQNQASDKRAVVFAAGKYMGQRDLTVKNITFCQLPYEMHRTE